MVNQYLNSDREMYSYLMSNVPQIGLPLVEGTNGKPKEKYLKAYNFEKLIYQNDIKHK